MKLGTSRLVAGHNRPRPIRRGSEVGAVGHRRPIVSGLVRTDLGVGRTRRGTHVRRYDECSSHRLFLQADYGRVSDARQDSVIEDFFDTCVKLQKRHRLAAGNVDSPNTALEFGKVL